MPLLTAPFDPAIGPTIPVTVAYPSSLVAREGSPAVEVVSFLIDSGAMQTAISTRIADRLQLPELGVVKVKSVTHESLVREYLADALIPVGHPPVALRDLRLMEFPSGWSSVDGLVARDVLQHGLFELNGPARVFALAF